MAAKTRGKDTKDLLHKAIVLGSSFVYLGQGVADDVVTELEKNKILSGKEGKALAKKIRSEVSERREVVRKKVLSQLGSVLDDLGVARKKDITALKRSLK